VAKVISYVPQILDRWSREQKDLVDQAGLLLKTEVRRLMTTSPRSGRTYSVPVNLGRQRGRAGRRARRRASAPGEPPAVVTGRLRRSIGYKIGLSRTGFFAAVGSNRVGAATLEYGNRFTKPRPAWRPALETVLPKIKALFDRA